MRKITFILLLGMVSLVGKAALPYDWNTFYATSAINSDGTHLETGLTPAVNAWNVGGTATGINPSLVANDLSYTDGNSDSYIDNNVGKAISMSAPVAVRTSVFYLTSAGYTTGTFYVSFLLNVATGTAPSSVAQLLNFNQSSTGNSSYGRVYIKQASGNTGFLLATGAYSNNSVYSSPLSYNTTHLIVLKYVMNSTPSQESYLFINPDLSSSEPSPSVTGAQNSSAVTVKGLVVTQIIGLTCKIGGLRLSSSWADAVKSSATKLSTPIIGAATSTTSTGFTANWSTVNNASGYDVKVYMGNNLISTTNFGGQATTSGEISGLMSGITYTYKVVAKGDGSTYSDSDQSTSSENITTSDPYAVNSINTDFNDGSWGTVSSSLSYGNSSINGFELISAVVYTGTTKGIKGESHTNRIGIDKLSNGGKITLPTVNSLEQLEIHATAGTGGNNFLVKEFNATNNTWDLVSTCIYSQYTKNYGLDSIYTINISRTQPTKFRIENPSNGVINICQIITRTTAPTTLTTPTVGTGASSVTNTAFTADWSTVANADSYDVRVFRVNSTSPVSFTQVTTSQNGNSISGLTPNTTYIYRVFANTNNSLYLDSYMSIPSEQFSTPNTFSIASSSNISSLTTLNSSSDITINTGGTLTLDANTTVNSITVAPGAKVTLADTKTLTGTLTLQSDAGGTATFIDENPTGATVSGIIQQHLTSGRNWYMSIPISNANTSNFSTAGSVAGYYEPTGLWYTQTLDSVLNPMRGYISVATASTGIVSFAGTLNTGEKFIDLKRTSTAAKPGFNLVGNPYPSYVSWEAATKTNLEPTIWYRSRNAGNTAYIFDTYNAATHTGTGLNGSNVTTYIPPMQAFWVRVSAGSTTGRLTLNNTMRSHASGTNKLKAPAVVDQQVVRLKVSNGVNEDEAILVFNANASNGFDGYDSQKQSNTNKAIPEIYTLAGNEEVVINGLNSIPTSSEVALGFRTGELNNFSIKASEISNFDNATRIVLKDNTLNKEIDLTDGAVYNFSSDATNTNSRFSLLFKAPTTVTAIDSSSSQNNALVCVNAGNQLIINNAIGSNAALYNSVGQLIENKELASNSATLNTKLSAGIYFVKINFENTVSQYKIRIN